MPPKKRPAARSEDEFESSSPAKRNRSESARASSVKPVEQRGAAKKAEAALKQTALNSEVTDTKQGGTAKKSGVTKKAPAALKQTALNSTVTKQGGTAKKFEVTKKSQATLKQTALDSEATDTKQGGSAKRSEATTKQTASTTKAVSGKNGAAVKKANQGKKANSKPKTAGNDQTKAIIIDDEEVTQPSDMAVKDQGSSAPKKAPRRAISKNFPTVNTMFPEDQSGDIYVLLGRPGSSNAVRLHSAILCTNSDWFSRSLSDSVVECSPKLASNFTKKNGIAHRYELELRDADSEEWKFIKTTITMVRPLSNPSVSIKKESPEPDNQNIHLVPEVQFVASKNQTPIKNVDANARKSLNFGMDGSMDEPIEDPQDGKNELARTLDCHAASSFQVMLPDNATQAEQPPERVSPSIESVTTVLKQDSSNSQNMLKEIEVDQHMPSDETQEAPFGKHMPVSADIPQTPAPKNLTLPPNEGASPDDFGRSFETLPSVQDEAAGKSSDNRKTFGSSSPSSGDLPSIKVSVPSEAFEADDNSSLSSMDSDKVSALALEFAIRDEDNKPRFFGTEMEGVEPETTPRQVPKIKQEEEEDDANHVIFKTPPSPTSKVVKLIVRVSTSQQADDANGGTKTMSADKTKEEIPVPPKPDNAKADQPKDIVVEGFMNLFKIFYRLEPNISTNKFEDATTQTELLTYLTTHYGLTSPDKQNSVNKFICKRLLAFGDELWMAIKEDPPRWLYHSLFLQCGAIFKEALVHMIGMYPMFPWTNIPENYLTPYVQCLIRGKAKDLRNTVANVERSLHGLTTYINGVNVLERGAKGGVASEAVRMWHDWHREQMQKECYAWSIDNSATALRFRLMGEAGHAYLAEDHEWNRYKETMEAQEHRFDDTDEARFKDTLKDLKQKVRDIVRPLLNNSSKLDRRNMEYLTCVYIDDEELPWVWDPTMTELGFVRPPPA
ncbi:hypothetical protein HYFRA_00004070 [Hymenoscyphus fraxineus]|uniref:BTB domain-containing protein n=1 Tax=Hymenoscyphus fraxineus TaxID=746836 RepID=A0A9N9KLY9_9HELO|nr:hypothetical protein HYFRA_00004070 [Hymenoscyphus fraxineus]